MDDPRLTERVKRLNFTLTKLDRIRKVPLEEFLKDPFLSDAAERNLQVSIEILLNMGNQLIVQRDFPRPQTLTEVFAILCDNNILSSSLRDELVRLAQLRDLLVHSFAKIDRMQVYTIVQHRIDQLRTVGNLLGKALEEKPE